MSSIFAEASEINSRDQERKRLVDLEKAQYAVDNFRLAFLGVKAIEISSSFDELTVDELLYNIQEAQTSFIDSDCDYEKIEKYYESLGLNIRDDFKLLDVDFDNFKVRSIKRIAFIHNENVLKGLSIAGGAVGGLITILGLVYPVFFVIGAGILITTAGLVFHNEKWKKITPITDLFRNVNKADKEITDAGKADVNFSSKLISDFKNKELVDTVEALSEEFDVVYKASKNVRRA